MNQEEQEILEALEQSRLKRAANAEDIQRRHARYAEQQRQELSGKVPNSATPKAMAELDGGKGESFDNAESLFRDLHGKTNPRDLE